MGSEWQTVEFSEVLLNSTRNGVYKSKEFHGSGTKIVNMGELFANSRLFDVPMKRVELSGVELEKSSLRPGDLLFARRSLVAEGAGKCSIVMEINEPTTFESSIIRARPNPEKTNSLFLYYLFSSPQGRYLLGTILRQVAVSGVTGSDLVKLRIPFPPLPEQRAIAHILGALDDKIELNRQMNQTLEAIARALFKSWFVDFDPVKLGSPRSSVAGAAGPAPGDPRIPPRIADLFPDELVESELGEIPKGWKVAGLDEIATFLNGLALQKYPPKDGQSLPVIKIAQLRKGNTEGADQASADLPRDYIVEDGDVLFSWSGSLECSLWTGGRGALNQHLFKVTSDRFPRWFYYFWIHHHLDSFRQIAAGKATTMGHIQRHHLSDAKVLTPPSMLLNAMDRVIAPMIAILVSRSLESRTLAALRDTLLPKLISGELRVPEGFLQD